MLAVALGLLLLVPAAWVGWSVARYFTIDRACGIDHYDPAYARSRQIDTREVIATVEAEALDADGRAALAEQVAGIVSGR